jgi:hypothetical protein
MGGGTNMRSFRANATDINKTPMDVRYVFILEIKGGKFKGNLIGALTTYRTLNENLSLGVLSVRVVDLKNNIVSELKMDQLQSFLDEWRENYFDYDWDIPFQFFR